MANSKIRTQKEIIKIVEDQKKLGRKVVTLNGSFDILHLGHIKSFKEAKKQGDILIILLNSDKSIKKYKGPAHPINLEKNRAEALSALKFIDYIVIFDEINPKPILEKIKPDIHCNGSDWGKNCIEREAVEENGGEIHILKWQKGFSTSAILEKKLGTGYKPDIKAVFLDRDGTININRPGCVREISQFNFAPGAVSALKKLSKTDYRIIIITNQSGVGRGYFAEEGLDKIHNWMLKKLSEEGIKIDKIYYCPHLPEDNCPCRKPKIKMFLQAVADFGINLSKSWFIGDDEKDVIAGREANIKTIKIGSKMREELKLEPNLYAKNLSEAIAAILKNE
jgi:D-glycero-D-manno-heptose 1,7-bisphosphate phosphatase